MHTTVCTKVRQIGREFHHVRHIKKSRIPIADPIALL